MSSLFGELKSQLKSVKLCVLTLIFVPYCNIASQVLAHTHPLEHTRPSLAPFLMRANLVIYLQDRSFPYRRRREAVVTTPKKRH